MLLIDAHSFKNQGLLILHCLKSYEELILGNELTLFQMTNFRLLQIERVCRRQIQTS